VPLAPLYPILFFHILVINISMCHIMNVILQLLLDTEDSWDCLTDCCSLAQTCYCSFVTAPLIELRLF